MKSKLTGRSLKDILASVGPLFLFVLVALIFAYKYVNPAPPRHVVMTTDEVGGEYQADAKLYQDILKEDGIDLEIRPSSGAVENLHSLLDPKSDVDVGFVQDGIAKAEDAEELSSLGSLYYEPIWFFYRGTTKLTRFAQLLGKKIAIGQHGGGTTALTWRLLKAAGVDKNNTEFDHLAFDDAAAALRDGKVDAAFFMGTPEDPFIRKMLNEKLFHLASLDQAEAITRQFPYLHHLVLPHGAIDLKNNIPDQDIDMVSPTVTLIMRDSLHPALIYLLLKAADQIHSDPGIFEKKNEFPIDKDYDFPLSDEAKHFYKSGAPFWQRYLPFWLATLVDRFILVMLPLLALLIPIVKAIPKIYDWRLKSRFYKNYGELKFLETQIRGPHDEKRREEFMGQLDHIEERVNHMKVPLDFSDHIYGLREHIDFVRGRLQKRKPLS